MMRVGGPHLGAVDDEIVAHIDGMSLDGGQIRAMIRFRQTLAPDFLGRRNFWNVALLLLGRSPLHQGRTHARDTLEVDRGRRLRAVELLIVDKLLEQRRATPAILLGPMDAHPARIIELAMPRTPTLELGVGIGVELDIVAPITRQVLFEPTAKFTAKFLVLVAELEIHRATLFS